MNKQINLSVLSDEPLQEIYKSYASPSNAEFFVIVRCYLQIKNCDILPQFSPRTKHTA